MAFLVDAQGVTLSDQASLNFAQSNLTYVEPGIYRKKYLESNYSQYMTVTTAGAQWAATATWYTMDGTGEAKWLNGASTDVPYVEVSMDQKNSPNYMIGSGFQWNVEEVNQALIAGVNLTSEKPAMARRVVERKLYNVAIKGDTEKGAAFTGLINDAGVFASDVAATGTGSSTFWPSKTPAQILFDLNTLLTGVQTATGLIMMADTVLLGVTAFNYIASTPMGTNGDSITILEYFRRNNTYTATTGQPLTILTVPELDTASASGDGRIVAYRNDPEVVDFWLPMPFMMLPLRSRSLMSFEGAGLARTGGTRIKLPAAIRYADQVTDA